MTQIVSETTGLLKLNLGCGQNQKEGYLNVDKFGEPDLRCDLEQFPWPWEDNSVDEVVLNHVLEHLGETTDVYLGIIKELYRVCCPNAVIKIAVPHPRHDDFLTDPTHVRPITPDGLAMFSQRLNREWAAKGAANTPLGLYLAVDFELTHFHLQLDEPWGAMFQAGKLSEQEVQDAMRRYNNVVKQMIIELRVVKEA